MQKNRVEAFSDGVIAIIITIMVLEFKVPHEVSSIALQELLPAFVSHTLSFLYIAIYWNNHHHLFHSVQKVNGKILWANMHLLFWLSLIPFFSGWMGENRFASLSVTMYGLVIFLSAVAYMILVNVLLQHHGSNSVIFKAIGNKRKEILSLVIYFSAILISFWYALPAIVLYYVVALMWVVPDSRIEKVLN